MMATVLPFSIALGFALLALLLWAERRNRFSRRYRAAVGHALAPHWFVAPVIAIDAPIELETPEIEPPAVMAQAA